jgi:hypothetical protein
MPPAYANFRGRKARGSVCQESPQLQAIMITTLAYLAYAAIVITFAELCSKWDAEEIAYRTRTNGLSLDHAPMWRFRAGFVAALALGVWLLANHEAPQHWSLLLPLLGFGAFAFSAWFRYRLNKRRGRDWRYVSPSNWYDWQFIRHTLGWVNKRDYQARVREFHGINYFEPVGTPEYFMRIHRAGTIAYYCELTITAACILWVALTL